MNFSFAILTAILHVKKRINNGSGMIVHDASLSPGTVNNARSATRQRPYGAAAITPRKLSVEAQAGLEEKD
ncbi:hypothetical protein [Serratia sp. AKBS12]|uniref:hypothetical protein n=1 Tax=Serratia sp. AKBS12 TaxID=2974597 RepID=UPI002165D807|nr:hypothetical protein [Serratia sp. AKBS12]MCS3408091.1 hypothetical protein [Serratia sp. AKBS12]